ncbi:unnamed protein product [Prunus armeniaca]
MRDSRSHIVSLDVKPKSSEVQAQPSEVGPKSPDVFMHVTRSIQGKQSKRVMSIWNVPKEERIK